MTIPLVTVETATPEQAELLRRTPPINLFGLLAHAPGFGARIAALGGQVMGGDPVLRELIAIRVGWRLGGGYVMAQHRRVAPLFGVDPMVINAALGDSSVSVSALHGDVLALADSVAGAHILNDSVSSRIETAIGREALVGLVVSAGYFAMLAGITCALALPLEEMKASESPEPLK